MILNPILFPLIFIITCCISYVLAFNIQRLIEKIKYKRTYICFGDSLLELTLLGQIPIVLIILII